MTVQSSVINCSTQILTDAAVRLPAGEPETYPPADWVCVCVCEFVSNPSLKYGLYQIKVCVSQCCVQPVFNLNGLIVPHSCPQAVVCGQQCYVRCYEDKHPH